jgi:hypothetical protein
LRMLEGRLTRASIMLTLSNGLSGDGSQRNESMWKGQKSIDLMQRFDL